LADRDEYRQRVRLYRRTLPLPRTPRPDFAYFHHVLARRGVTRLLLWKEYKAAHPDGWQYSSLSLSWSETRL
jgi:transposase